MKLTKAMLSLAACALIFTACKKDEETTPHHNANEVTIEIVRPATDQYIFCNNVNHLEVNIQATEEIHGYEVKLINLADNSLQWEKHAHVHGTNIQILDSTITTTVCDSTNARLDVTVILDHNGNTKTQSQNVLLGEAL